MPHKDRCRRRRHTRSPRSRPMTTILVPLTMMTVGVMTGGGAGSAAAVSCFNVPSADGLLDTTWFCGASSAAFQGQYQHQALLLSHRHRHRRPVCVPSSTEKYQHRRRSCRTTSRPSYLLGQQQDHEQEKQVQEQKGGEVVNGFSGATTNGVVSDDNQVENNQDSSSSSSPSSRSSSSSSSTKDWSIIVRAVTQQQQPLQPQQRPQQQKQQQQQQQQQQQRDPSGGLLQQQQQQQQPFVPQVFHQTSPLAEYVLFTFPFVVAAVSLQTHRSFALLFHNVCDAMTKMGWDDASTLQHGTNTLDLVRSGLNGPVVTSIAILFGTLVASTISTLIDRNVMIQKAGIGMGEEVRVTRVMLDSFSPYYRDEGNRRLNVFVEKWLADFWSGRTSVGTLRQLTPYLEECIRLIHDANRDPDEKQSGAAIGETYASLTRLRAHQTESMAQTQRSFPWFHYANLMILGLGVCIIFLIDTDPDTVQNNFAAEPQLALSWSLLVGTLSMLFVVISDLMSPIAGITRRIFASDDLNLKQIEMYVRCWNVPNSTSSCDICEDEDKR